MNDPSLEEVKEPKESIELGGLDHLGVDLKDVYHRLTKVLLRHKTIEVPIEALESLLYSDALGANPVLDLGKHSIFPVEVVLDSLLVDSLEA